MDKVILYVMFNNQRFDPEQFGTSSIVKESGIVLKQFDPREPNWVNIMVNSHSLDDETDFFQYGQSVETEFLGVTVEDSNISSWNDNLIENPDGRYKFNSMEINFSQDLVLIQR